MLDEHIRKLLNHDLRSCLQAVINYNSIVKSETENLSPRHKEFLDRIEVRSLEAMDILNQVKENLNWE